MQRQSIGSPTRVHAVAGEVAPIAPEAEEIKPEKPIRTSYTTERTVHLIPVLTLLCLLVLYLSSHDPSSTSDVASTDDTDTSRFIHANLMTEMGRYEGGAATGAIANHRGLKADAKFQIRKLGSAKEQGSAEDMNQ